MKAINILVFLILAIFSSQLLAYGGSSSSKKKCKKPTFTNVSPEHLATVPHESNISFHTSAATLPHSIRVIANKIPVEIDVKKTNDGFVVSGKLPDAIKRKYVRIDFSGTTTNSCQGTDGWLLEIEQKKSN